MPNRHFRYFPFFPVCRRKVRNGFNLTPVAILAFWRENGGAVMVLKQSPEEVGLSEAAGLLGVSEKTIRNYIKLKKLKAVKVAKSWYIDKASLLAIGDHISPSAEAKPMPAAAARDEGQGTAGGTAAIHKLACYRLFLNASERFEYSNEADGLAEFFKGQCRDTLAYLGAGYYAYGRNKKSYYEMARGAIGKIIAVLAADAALYQRHYKTAQNLEHDVLPAFGALMRKLDRAAGVETPPPRKVGGGATQETGRSS